MVEREVFWHNYRSLRVSMRNADRATRRRMKMIAKNGYFSWPILEISLAYYGDKDAIAECERNGWPYDFGGLATA